MMRMMMGTLGLVCKGTAVARVGTSGGGCDEGGGCR